MNSFIQYIAEKRGVAKAGFDYEKKIQVGLFKAGYAKTKATAGSTNRADVVFLHKGKEYNLEIGILGKDFAQGKVHWNTETNKWYADTRNSETLTKFLQTLTYDDDLMDTWGPVAIGARTKVTAKKRVAAARRGGDLYLTDVPARMIWDYYNDKGTHYIQVNGHGAYYMKKNPLNLPLPRFTVVPELRFRVKGYGSSSAVPHDTTWAVKIPASGFPKSDYTFDTKDSTRKGPSTFLRKR